MSIEAIFFSVFRSWYFHTYLEKFQEMTKGPVEPMTMGTHAELTSFLSEQKKCCVRQTAEDILVPAAVGKKGKTWLTFFFIFFHTAAGGAI